MTRAAFRSRRPWWLLALAVLTSWAPAGARAQEGPRGEIEQSARKMRRLVNAMHEYHKDNGLTLPRPAIVDGSGKPVLSWRVALLPYLGERGLYERFRLDEPWDSPHNKNLIAEMPRIFAPVGDTPTQPNTTFYQVFAGPGSAFDPGRAIDYPDIRDGTVWTVAIVEAEKAVPWTKPEDLAYAPDKPLPKLGGNFKDVFMVAFVSGDLRAIEKGLDESLIRAIITRDGGEVIAGFRYGKPIITLE